MLTPTFSPRVLLPAIVLLGLGGRLHAAEPMTLGASDFTIGVHALHTSSTRFNLTDRALPFSVTDAASLVLVVSRTSSTTNVLSIAVRIHDLFTNDGDQLAEITGEAPLTLEQHAQQLKSRNGHPLPLVHEVSLTIRPPKSSAKRLVRMRGSMAVWYETGGSLPPLDLHAPATLIGKRMEVGFAGLGLTISTCTDRETSMHLDAGLHAHLAGIDIMAGDKLLTHWSTGTNWLNNTYNTFHRRDPPADVTMIRLRLIGHTALATFPITLDNIPLSVPDEDGG